MRLLLGGLLLVALFSAAAFWQKGWTASARAQRDAARREAATSSGGSEARWSRVVVGRPSGGEPFVLPAENSRAAPESVATGTVPPPSDATRQGDALSPQRPSEVASTPAGSVEVVVLRGQSLSAICQAHYGSTRLEILDAVARYNNLEHPDSVREGQRLRLPAFEELNEGR